MRVVITGGAGLIGSHLADLLVGRGDRVVAVDDLSTGRRENLDPLAATGAVELVEADVAEGLDVDGPVDAVCHLASPASPADFAVMPRHILRAGSLGTFHAVDLAARRGARLLLASTSEVYGDPLVHPQDESYRGNVNPIGPRACYDEAKRFAEAVVSSARRHDGVDTTIARIFNTYGPRMRPDDGRVVSNFVVQALSGRPLTVYGGGTQTRSFCYVEDLAAGLAALLDSGHPGPVNLGNPSEFTVRQLAESVLSITGADVELTDLPLPEDDPLQRCPDISLARAELGWKPTTPLEEGLRATVEYFRGVLSR